MDKPKMPRSRKVIRPADKIELGHEISWGNKKIVVSSKIARPRRSQDDPIMFEIWGSYRPRGKVKRTSTSFVIREDRSVTIHNWIDPPQGES